MTAPRYTLQPYKGMNTRHLCPRCQHRAKTFSIYIDTETQEQLDPAVGRCNRESNCGYHYTPKQYFIDTGAARCIYTGTRARTQCSVSAPKPVSFVPVEVFKASLKAFEKNDFAQYLITLFGSVVASELISRYFIGTSKHWPGSTVFWQIDLQGKIRTGKIMLYDPDTGKRIKVPFSHITWVHKALKKPAFELQQCLFGAHLLQDQGKPVALVESEKTAVIASAYLPQFIWLAVGSLTNFSAERCSILKGRSVFLFPDLNGFEKWNSKAKELSALATFTVSDLLEKKATEEERQQGFDLADYLIRFDFKHFVFNKAEKVPALLPTTEVEKSRDEYIESNITNRLKITPAEAKAFIQFCEDLERNNEQIFM